MYNKKKKSCVPISADPQSAFLCYSVIVRITDFFLKKKNKNKTQTVIEKGITLSLNTWKGSKFTSVCWRKVSFLITGPSAFLSLP